MTPSPTDPAESPFDIDPRRLDAECLHQAQLSRAASVREADARHAHAQAKAGLEVVQARMALRLRAAPGAFGLRDKPTVDEIAAAVTVQDDVIAAVAAVNEAQYALDVARADSNAFLDRRKMLERLVDLACIDWHAEREPAPRTAAGRDASAAHRLRASVGEGIDVERRKSE